MTHGFGQPAMIFGRAITLVMIVLAWVLPANSVQCGR